MNFIVQLMGIFGFVNFSWFWGDLVLFIWLCFVTKVVDFGFLLVLVMLHRVSLMNPDLISFIFTSYLKKKKK